MATPPIAPQTAYTINATDLQGPTPYRLNVILQQINARLATLEKKQAAATAATGNIDGGTL